MSLLDVKTPKARQWEYGCVLIIVLFKHLQNGQNIKIRVEKLTDF
jgi:hypothetical protein